MKFDGYRAQAIKSGSSVVLISKNGKPLQYPEVEAPVRELPVESVLLHGEVVALDQEGREEKFGRTSGNATNDCVAPLGPRTHDRSPGMGVPLHW